MLPSHPRGSQPPTSHVVPGGSGAVGQLPYMGFVEPPTIFPASFLAEIIGAIRGESHKQAQFIGDQYSSVVSGYREMNERFELYVRQTDRILADQHARFEQKLDGIQKDMCQFHENQIAAVTGLGESLNSFKGLTEASRDTLTSAIATTAETMKHGFGGLAVMIKNSEYAARDPSSFESGIPASSAPLEAFPSPLKLPDGPSCAGDAGHESWLDYIHGVKDAPTPGAQSQYDSEVDVSATLAHPSSSSVEPGGPREEQPIEPPPAPASTSTSSDEIEEQDQLYEWGTPAVSTPVTEVPLVSPTMDENDATIVPASLSTISPEATPTTPTPNHNLLRDSLFDAPSPLTPMNSPSLLSQEEEHPPIAFLEDTTPAPDQASLNTKGRKRKRTSSRRAMQNPRRRRKPRPEETWDATPNLIGFSEGSHTDPLIWPPVVEDGANSQKYVECERCAKWFHFGCVGLQGDHEDGSPWMCPLCTLDPMRDAADMRREGEEMCSRPGCIISKGGEFFMSQLLGRCYVPDQNVVKYLVAYDGFTLDQCTWEPPDSFSNDTSQIDEFLKWWAAENQNVDIGSLNPHETIFLNEAYVLARAGVTWPGA